MSSKYLNNYAAPPPPPRDIHFHTPPEGYDLNYVFEAKVLKSNKVELRPIIPVLHAQVILESYTRSPEVLRYLGFAPFKDLGDVLVWIEKTCRRASDTLMHAIYTQPLSTPSESKVDPKDYVFAGIIGMIASNYQAMICEPGYIMILPEFHRTHVQTHATGLVMHRILDHPEQGGLGLRRCQWITTTLNIASQNAAKRLGYNYEGVLRCMRVLPPGKEGARVGRQDVRQSDGQVRDDWYASVTWYEWEEGVRDHVDGLMSRQ
ncbi:uncharacterized protein I303_105304 [Kwoniella dejecticola CBS 10117]|uniref:N-acetyltransferase domain-containing protein n=1 Tax=Kwoniella dejecticola CBS 10117 TaxID=1296121 RepID=A0A1A6A2W1_9TREE|nr:uncharacterized protein I303_05249 [Kwoniella dejecticola CBS 10117]OBR84391.1 hypothetical protein I303_05249 [Kwoniella dejecticola CBS 10117]